MEYTELREPVKKLIKVEWVDPTEEQKKKAVDRNGWRMKSDYVYYKWSIYHKRQLWL